MKRICAALLVTLALGGAALAVNPSEILADPALEGRARAISAELRCLVCQNQSIEESDAELAGELRLLVRERLVAGDTDDQVRQYVVDRYGEFVLLRPVLAPHTIALWAAAPLLLLIGGCALVIALRRRRANAEAEAASLGPEEEAALRRLQPPAGGADEGPRLTES